MDVYKVFGAPGCGKTTRLMQILEYELTRVEPDQIAFVSFTRKGTYEGVQRAKEKFNFSSSDLPYFRTLHSLAFRAAGITKNDMVQRDNYKEFSNVMAMKFTGYYTEEFYNNDDRYLFAHFLRRNNERTFEHYADTMDVKTLRHVESNFARFKQYYRLHDFTDLLELFIAIDQPLPVRVAIVDEAQDLTTLQWKMCEVAFRKCERLYVAGDDDQAIYEWSGADVEHFLHMKGDIEVLSRSYRLQDKILRASRLISDMISERVKKEFDASGDDGEIYLYNTIQDVPINDDETYYFLSRNNWFLSVMRDYLRQEAKVFIDKGLTSYDPRHIEAINTLERARKRGVLTEADEVKLKLHLRGSPDLNKPWFEQLNIPNDQAAYYRDLIRCKTDLKKFNITLSTIHGVKGGEADNVVLLLDFTRAVQMNMERNPDSELRCLYVGMTRAKRNLHVVFSNSRSGYDRYIDFLDGVRRIMNDQVTVHTDQ